MGSGHQKLSRLARRAFEEVRASAAIGSETSFADGVNAFRAKIDLQKMNRNEYRESTEVTKRLMRKHESVVSYLESRFGSFYREYDFERPLEPVADDRKNKIWMCWWQGEENAPLLVKACIDSVRRNAGDREVIVITDENLGDYAEIPSWLMDKVDAGVVSRTNLSDYLRLYLLGQFGGIWLDATFYCVDRLSGAPYDAPVFTIKRPGYAHGSIACGNFAGYSLGCDADHRRLFSSACDFYLEYWKNSSFMVDYLLIDYLLALVERHCAEAKRDLDSVQPNNGSCDELIKMLGRPFDRCEWNSLKQGTRLFKLTWKQEFPLEVAGKETFYGALVNGHLL
ncbi:MAG: capsular polysaccharide synthesis protein [Coriobacteriaceae bacterium]|nr:capsular polysaccharide synthesis protein [Coriobacteriaceae bacterium]